MTIAYIKNPNYYNKVMYFIFDNNAKTIIFEGL